MNQHESPQAAPKRSHTTVLVIALCAIALITVGVVFTTLRYFNGWSDHSESSQNQMALSEYDRILPGVTVDGIDVSGLTQKEAADTINAALAAKAADDTFVVHFPDQDLRIGNYKLISIPTLDSVLKEAYQHGRNGVSTLEDAMAQAAAEPLHLAPAREQSIDESVITRALDSFSKKLDSRPTEAVIKEEEDCIRLTKGRDGKSIDSDSLNAQILSACRSEKREIAGTYQIARSGERQLTSLHKSFCREAVNASWDMETNSIIPEQPGRSFDLNAALKLLEAPDQAEIVIPVLHTDPELTETELQEVLFADTLAEYSSPHTAIPARTSNLTLACQTINGYVVNAGSVFSFNEVVGERTVEKGYQNAAIYLNGETTDGLGGGVCQVASTIYYCALYANLEIVERTEHMYLVDYVPPGLDATVYWDGKLDFQFRNNTEYPIRIDASVSGGYVHITLVGTKSDDSYVEMTYEILSVTPWEDVTVIDEGKPPAYSAVTTTPYTGYLVRSYRNIYNGDGTLISSETEAKSEYHKRDRVTTIGKQPEPEPEPEAEPEPPVIDPFDPDLPVIEPEDPEVPDIPIDSGDAELPVVPPPPIETEDSYPEDPWA